jgi:hypothetical protein
MMATYKVTVQINGHGKKKFSFDLTTIAGKLDKKTAIRCASEKYDVPKSAVTIVNIKE